ncbi:MAG: CoA-acylating methylmalonate-semialdehyde dehydrogenase [Sphingomonadales bacterium]
MNKTIPFWINGGAVAGSGELYGEVFDPATGSVQAQVPFATADELEQAIATAAGAFPAWAHTSPHKRASIMYRFRELLLANLAELSSLLSSEHGKTKADAAGEMQRGLENVEFACGIPHLLKGEMSPQVGRGIDSYSMRQPLGVCVGITPFNFPAMVPLWMFPLAIACGNTFVLKPSEKDPSCAIRLAELMTEAGLPAGVLNVIHGDKLAVDALIADPRITAISFVGSTPVASAIYQGAARHGKRVQALGGAKNHMIVMPDADLDLASDALVSAAFGSAGERCMAISAGVAVGDIADELIDRVRGKIETMKVGPGSDPESEMGPLITRVHKESVERYIDIGVAEGAKLVVDGRNLSLQGYEDGFFVGPTLFDNVSDGMRIHREEIFGPVLSMMRVSDYGTAVDLINNHQFANGTAVFTRSGEVARHFAADIKVGMVGINVPLPVPMAFHSFGGWKASIFGDHSIYGPEGVRFYTQLKTVTARWPSDIRRGADFAFPTMS